MTLEEILGTLLDETRNIRLLLQEMNKSNDLHFEEWRKKNIEHN